MDLDHLVENYTCAQVSSRYVINEHIDDFLAQLSSRFKVEVRGESVEKRPIKTVTWGVGKKRIMMWSQMHGNESTTTKGLLDFMKMLDQCDASFTAQWHAYFTFLWVPILNPDGAKKYTRLNANQVDLNRDSVDLTQPESKLLRHLFLTFDPHFAFNLHDQRTIFGVGDNPKPATVSFLSPSFNEARDINANRLEAMKVIGELNKGLQHSIPGQVGRFDDSFNLNCIGDYFQAQGVPTILFEAGHYPGDYEREISRKIVFRSLLIATSTLFTQSYIKNTTDEYFSIPENQKCFTDVRLEHVELRGSGEVFIVNIQYLEQIKQDNVKFCPIIVDIIKKETKFAHLYVKDKLFFKEHVVNIEDALDRLLTDVVDFGMVEVNYLLK